MRFAHLKRILRARAAPTSWPARRPG
jgi:hypothetical protein